MELCHWQGHKRNSGTLAIETNVAWVLSGPVSLPRTSVNLAVTATHSLRIDAPTTEETLDTSLNRFWDLESLGILKEEKSVYDTFIQQISFNGERYEVSLPWRFGHQVLPDNYQLCHHQLIIVVRRFKHNPTLLAKYDNSIQDQLSRGIIEVVHDPNLVEGEQVHYLPHHGVMRQDKTTFKLRIVYDALAKSTCPSLNDYLYTVPSFGQSIFDILIQFRVHGVALAGDIEKAFLMVAVNKVDRDVLHFYGLVI